MFFPFHSGERKKLHNSDDNGNSMKCEYIEIFMIERSLLSRVYDL